MTERIPSSGPYIPKFDNSEITDWLEGEPEEVQTLFSQLPEPLWKHHYEALEKAGAEGISKSPEAREKEKIKYLSDILEARKSKQKEFKSNDPRFRTLESGDDLGGTLYELLTSSEGTLGAGATAQVKRHRFEDGNTAAVKYLLTPLETTLSAQAEHDMLREVDTVTYIEEEEQKVNAGDRIRVPHPYFYYKDDKLQCYAMEEIKGRNIEQLIDARTSQSEAQARQQEAIWEALRRKYSDPVEQAALYAELDRFATAMHAVCLHKDIKLANMMVDEEGAIYLIDFGQSERVMSITDKSEEQMENLQATERTQLRYCIGKLLGGIARAKLAA